MATQLLNADADLATIQDLLGHGQITTTQRYCWVASLKVQRAYYKAMEVVLLQRTQARGEDDDEREHGFPTPKKSTSSSQTRAKNFLDRM